jgi:hypothetical protein
MPNEPSFADLHQALIDRYDLEELRTLCAQLGIPFDDLRGEGRQAKARELILWLKRHDRLEELIDALSSQAAPHPLGPEAVSVSAILSSPCEKTYLQHFIAFLEEAQKPWGMDRWVPLAALKSQQNVPARRVTIRMQSFSKKEEGLPPQSIPLLGRPIDDLFSFLNREPRVVVLGEPGSGKTFVVRRWLWEMAYALLKGQSPLGRHPCMPIYIDASEYRGRQPDGHPDDVVTFLKSYLGQFGFSSSIAASLDELLSRGHLVVVFDGLNQMPSEDYYRRLQLLYDFASKQYPSNHFVFTCRTLHHDEMLDYDTVILLDLGKEQMRQFLQAYLKEPDLAEMAFQDLEANADLARHCSRPFVLQMYATVFQSMGQSPGSRAELFRQFVHLQLDQAGVPDAITPEKRLDELITRALSELAFAMCEDGQLGTSVSTRWIGKHTSLQTQMWVLELAALSGILDISPINERIAFSHHILQEYFAALEMQKWVDLRRNLEKIFTNPAWEEVVMLCAGLSPDLGSFIQLVLGPAPVEPYRMLLAAKIVHENHLDQTPMGEWVITKLSRLVIPEEIPVSIESRTDVQRIYWTVDAVMVLSNFEDHAIAVESICRALQSENPWLLEVAVHGLVSAPAESLAQQRLLDTVRALPWGISSMFSSKHDLEEQLRYRMKMQMGPLLEREIASLPKELQSEVRRRKVIRRATDSRLWGIPAFVIVIFVSFAIAINHFYSSLAWPVPSPIIAWFTVDHFLQVVLPLVYGAAMLLVLFLFAVSVRDNWSEMRKMLAVKVWKEMLSTRSGRLTLLVMALILALYLVLMFSQQWMLEQTEKVLESQLFETLVRVVCLPAAGLFMTVIQVYFIFSQVWFYVHLRRGHVEQMLFENWMPGIRMVGDTPRLSMVLVALGSISLAFLSCLLSMTAGSWLFRADVHTFGLALGFAILAGLPAAIVVVHGIRQRKRLVHQRRHLRSLLDRLNANTPADSALILELGQLALDERQHSSVRVQAITTLGHASQSSNKILELIEPLIESEYPKIRAAAARAVYQIRHRLKKSMPYAKDVAPRVEYTNPASGQWNQGPLEIEA